ncbi:MAG: hypothetical protein KGI80_03725 [Verrucomicrobiota bacterium]|nr:hypothetical protein [Verrucomicrobiota bacterium]
MFVLSVPVYEAKKMAYSVEKYIEARRDRIFLPHATSFVRNGESVLLVQKIPFQWGVSLNTRKDILDFLQLGKRCHALLHELALEEQYQAALDALLTE